MLKLSRIQSRALMLGLLPAAVVAVALTAHLIMVRLASLERTFAENGHSLARELAAFAVHALETGDHQYLARSASHLLDRNDLVGAELRDAAGVLVASTRGTQRPGTDSETFTAPVLHYDHTSRGAAVIGSVTLRLAEPSRLASQRTHILTGLLIGGGVLLATTFIALALARRVSQPLQRLTAAFARLERGELGVEVPVVSRGELRSLEEGFNAMVQRLRLAQGDLQAQVKRATADLVETMEALEIRNVELDLARKRALEASRSKSEFLASMSHEIRTPMNGILGFANLLAKTELTVTQKDYLGTMVASATALLGLINDILDFSKLEAGKLSLSQTSLRLRETLEDAVALLAPQAHDKGLELVILIYDDVPDLLVGDGPRLRQILINLLANAAKFTHQGDIVVRAMLEDATPDTVSLRLSVSDSGIGIPAERLPHLFNAFDQGSQRISRMYGGSGLGLAIARRLAEAMNGRITVDSHEGVGSTFDVTLTLGRAQGPDPPDAGGAVAGLRVLLYDGHRLSGLALRHRLSAWGAEVQRCEEADQLIDMVCGADPAPQLVVLGLSASQSAQTHRDLVRRCRERCETPILALVSSSDNDHMAALQRLGADACLSKPAPGPILLRTLRALLARQWRAEPAPSVTTPPPAARPSLTHLRVLAADDNEINLRLIAQLLASAGADVTQARNGREVMERVRRQSFDLVLLDVHMPEMDGLEAARRIRSAGGRLSTVPLIALTADAEPRNRREIGAAGFDDCLIKPLDEVGLWRLVRRLVYGGREVVADASHPPQTPDAAPVRDPEAALRSAGGNGKLATEMLHAFLAELRPALDAMGAQQRAGDWPALAETAHRLQGSTAYCGVPALRAALRTLERDTKNGAEPQAIAQRLTAVETESTRVLAAVAEEQETAGAGS